MNIKQTHQHVHVLDAGRAASAGGARGLELFKKFLAFRWRQVGKTKKMSVNHADADCTKKAI